MPLWVRNKALEVLLILNGFINFLKPPGITSHDVVEIIRSSFPQTKVGHGGTLDPGAAGVLPILLGKATKLSAYLLNLPKLYRAELFLGITTDSDDSTGRVIDQKKAIPLNIEKIEEVFNTFVGEIYQTPPMFSAIKQKGKKLYEYARKGVTLHRNPRKVIIYLLKIIDYFPPERILLEVKCSKGTYVRTLCRQLGEALGFGGHMSFLLRKEVGNFLLSEAITFEDLNFYLNGCFPVGKILLPPDFPFRHMDALFLEWDSIENLIHGARVALKVLRGKNLNSRIEPVDGKIVAVYTTKREFLGLARWKINKNAEFVLIPEKIIDFNN